MICFIALFVFAFLAIFSARYRPFAIEAFDCVFKRMTLRPCTTGFDKKMKMRISMKLLQKHEGLGKFVNRHFEAISWTLTILMVASFVLSAIGFYNWIAFGNCNGPNSNEPCILNTVTGQTEPLNCDCNHGSCTKAEIGYCRGDCNCLLSVCANSK